MSTFAFVSFFSFIQSFTPLSCRTKLDLGIVKKSIAVDDVSKYSNQRSHHL